jgi:hypothetical protein
MSNEFVFPAVSGLNLYSVLLNAQGQALNMNTGAFESRSSADWSAYELGLSDTSPSTGLYTGNMPSVPAGIYTVIAYQRSGSSPAAGDPPAGFGRIEWDGSAEVSLASRAAAGGVMQLDLTQALADTNAATIGGALHGAWSVAFGKMVLNVVAKTLSLFGFNSQSVPLKTFNLDSGTAPGSRTPQ